MKCYRVSDYYKSISLDKPGLQKQFTPDKREDIILPYETSDPLDEVKYMVVPRLIHRYKDRVLLLVTDKCLLYCRHCFRRDFINSGSNELKDQELDKACEYLALNPQIHEVLLSGGDPLTLDPERLLYILKKIKLVRSNIIIRIGSRVPIVDPRRITNRLIEVLQSCTPVWIAIQTNHPDELTRDNEDCLVKLANSGINLINQSVLLKGINDSVEILKKLSYRLLECRVKPYYIFQGDLAKGTSHFRVPLERGLKIIYELRSQISGIAMPIYAVDIPGGGGKIPLTKDYITGEDDNFYYLTNNLGFTGKYPKEIE